MNETEENHGHSGSDVSGSDNDAGYVFSDDQGFSGAEMEEALTLTPALILTLSLYPYLRPAPTLTQPAPALATKP